MAYESLVDWLKSESRFATLFPSFHVSSVSQQFRVKSDVVSLEHQDWRTLIFVASVLAPSQRGADQSIALRIATSCLGANLQDESLQDAAAVILDTLRNKPAIDLAEKRELLKPGFLERVSISHFLDIQRRAIESSIKLNKQFPLTLNNFQLDFWNAVKSNRWVSLSAPTSSGKSFIIETWLIDQLREEINQNLVFIVPSRALIQQVHDDLLLQIKNYGMSGVVSLNTLPIRSKISANKTNLFVFTQERLHLLLGNSDIHLPIHVLIVDEAHKIGDGARGVLLQSAIEKVVRENPNSRVIFASPQTSNPGLLLDWAPPNVSSMSLLRDDVTVNQNLLWLSQDPLKPNNWELDLVHETDSQKIGRISLESSPAPSKRLPALAAYFGKDCGGNVLYVNGPSAAETVAKQLHDYLSEAGEKETEDEEILDLVNLVRKSIHSKYFLVEVLKLRIAFHYGNMPLLVRTEIERLFGCNKLRFLVCTSTLVEGVNMPCQNLFLRGAKRGGSPMSAADFWNLAGRAGRWGKEFQGNIFCIDPTNENVWPNKAPRSKEKVQIRSETDESIKQQVELLSYIQDGATFDSEHYSKNIEHVFSYVSSAFLRNGALSSLPRINHYDERFIKALEETVAKCLKQVEFPVSLIDKNPGISPLAMSSLYRYFEQRTNIEGKQVEDLVPPHPQSDQANVSLRNIIHRINRYLCKKEFGNAKRVTQLTYLILDWMRGKPLALLIASRERFYKDAEIRSIIRGTMDDVEEFARFKSPRYLSCYSDVLTAFLSDIGRQDLISNIEDLSMKLEFGVASMTQLSLVSLGLSRTTTIAVSEFIARDDLDEFQCLDWLRDRDWISRDLPRIVKNEIDTLIDKYAHSTSN